MNKFIKQCCKLIIIFINQNMMEFLNILLIAFLLILSGIFQVQILHRIILPYFLLQKDS